MCPVRLPSLSAVLGGCHELPKRFLLALVRGYRLFLSPWLGSSCRFEPTCSAYALVALQRHGARRGGALALWRIARCHPWCAGGHDPVPDHVSGPFTSLLTRPDEIHDGDTPEGSEAPGRPSNRKTSV